MDAKNVFRSAFCGEWYDNHTRATCREGIGRLHHHDGPHLARFRSTRWIHIDEITVPLFNP